MLTAAAYVNRPNNPSPFQEGSYANICTFVALETWDLGLCMLRLLVGFVVLFGFVCGVNIVAVVP